MVCVLREPLERRWFAPPSSSAGVCAFLGLFILIAAPLLIAIRTGGFLVEEATYREEPLVFFQNELVVTALDAEGTGVMTWSSIPELNALLGDKLRFPVVKVQEKDFDFNGRPDELSLQVQLPLLSTERVSSINVLMGFSYELREAADMAMQGLAFVSESTTGNPRSLHVTGDLALVQRRPLPSFGRRTVYNESLLRSQIATASDYTLPALLSKYSARNETTRLANTYAAWSQPRSSEEPFILYVTVRYPSQVVRFTPSVWHELKWMWVQFVALLLPFLWIITVLKRFALSHGVVAAVPKEPRLYKPHAS